MFFAGKLLALLTQPLGWVIGLLLLALLNHRWHPARSRRLTVCALLVLILIGWQPLPDALIRHLEQQYPAVPAQASLEQYHGVVVLGGALESARIWQGNGQVALNAAAERMTMAAVLMRQHPRLTMLFSGGEGDLIGYGPSEAERAAVFFDSMGAPGINPTQSWLLLTSASHMPRAMASYRKAGWNVTAYPVDFRAGLQTPWWEYSLMQGTQRWQLALHELIGYAAYRLAGRT
jgi:uncharacterized SAM-binding protein YcdF (DUF218 family)